MGFLAPLASLLGIEAEALIRRIRENAIAFAVIGLFGIICLVFLLVALDTALTWQVGQLWAALIIAVSALVIALIVFLILRMQQAALARRAAERRQELQRNAVVATAAISALPELLKSPVVRNVGVPLALLAGFLLLTRSSDQRRNLDDFEL